MRKTTVYLPDDLKLGLERVAAAEGLSEAELVCAAVDEYIRSHARPRPRFPLFSIGEVRPITDWGKALGGFAKD